MADAVLSRPWHRLALPAAAERIRASQSVDRPCQTAPAFYELTNYGLGSDLLQWCAIRRRPSQRAPRATNPKRHHGGRAAAACWAMMHNRTLVTVARGTVRCKTSSGAEVHSFQSDRKRADGSCTVKLVGQWIWDSEAFCFRRSRDPASRPPPLACYFGRGANPCTPAQAAVAPMALFACSPVNGCPALSPCGPGFEGPIAHLFSSLSPELLAVARRAARSTFGASGVPREMVAVHMRWGNKEVESPLVPIEQYVQAAEALVQRTGRPAEAHVFLITEDRAAVDAFAAAAGARHSSRWRVYAHWPAIMQDSRNRSEAKGGPLAPDSVARMSGGALGLHSLVALLLALEARRFVLTMSSSWGRLMEALVALVVRQDAEPAGALPNAMEEAVIRLDTRPEAERRRKEWRS